MLKFGAKCLFLILLVAVLSCFVTCSKIYSIEDDQFVYVQKGIGKGSTADIHKGYFEKDPSKTLYAQKEFNPRRVPANFKEQLELMKQVSSIAKNTIKVYHYEFSAMSPKMRLALYYMDIVDGTPVDKLRPGVLQTLLSNRNNFWKVVLDVSEGVESFSVNGYVHMDIAPRNVIVSFDNNNHPKATIIDIDSVVKVGHNRRGSHGSLADVVFDDNFDLGRVILDSAFEAKWRDMRYLAKPYSIDVFGICKVIAGLLSVEANRQFTDTYCGIMVEGGCASPAALSALKPDRNKMLMQLLAKEISLNAKEREIIEGVCDFNPLTRWDPSYLVKYLKRNIFNKGFKGKLVKLQEKFNPSTRVN